MLQVVSFVTSGAMVRGGWWEGILREGEKRAVRPRSGWDTWILPLPYLNTLLAQPALDWAAWTSASYITGTSEKDLSITIENWRENIPLHQGDLQLQPKIHWIQLILYGLAAAAQVRTGLPISGKKFFDIQFCLWGISALPPPSFCSQNGPQSRSATHSDPSPFACDECPGRQIRHDPVLISFHQK